uniref:SHSP domain-containing protein n=1 Tax=Cacopsylla melanoneura TaxID=428564 RepID=A0A8D9E7Y8_9HEMI
MSSNHNWSNVNMTSVGRTYVLKSRDNPPPDIACSAVDNVRHQLSDNYRSLVGVQHLYPLTGKMYSEFIAKVKSFLNSPNYEGALRYIDDDYYDFNDTVGSHWNVPYSPYLSHQVPGALPPPLCSHHLFPTEIEFGGEGVRLNIFMSGFAKCQIGSNSLTDFQIEGFDNMIRLTANVEEVQLDCSQQNYVGRKVTRTYHLPDPIVKDQMLCHYYADTGVLIIQATWLF